LSEACSLTSCRSVQPSARARRRGGAEVVLFRVEFYARIPLQHYMKGERETLRRVIHAADSISLPTVFRRHLTAPVRDHYEFRMATVARHPLDSVLALCPEGLPLGNPELATPSDERKCREPAAVRHLSLPILGPVAVVVVIVGA